MDSTSGPKREEVLRLIICQLSAYGYPNLGQAIATHTGVPMTAESSSRLEELINKGMRQENSHTANPLNDSEMHAAGSDNSDDNDDDDNEYNDESTAANNDEMLDKDSSNGGLDMDAENEPMAVVPEYKLWYQTTHKGMATAAAFSRDGQYIATGSADTTLKVIQVDRLRSPADEPLGPEEKPVIRTLYDHTAQITGLAFHPNGLVLASCSADRTIKLFDLSAAHGKRSFRVFQDNFAYRSISFHPSGEYLVAAGDAPELRLYDTRTGQGFLLREGAPERGATTQVQYAHNGSLIASSSTDGKVRFWDGASGKCVRTIENAHRGSQVTSIALSRNLRYALSSGLDSRACLWEVGSGRLVCAYEGVSFDTLDSQAVFSHDEAMVLAPDYSSNCVASWDTRSAELLARSVQHPHTITCIAYSPAAPAFISCAIDHKVRYWSPSDD